MYNNQEAIFRYANIIKGHNLQGCYKRHFQAVMGLFCFAIEYAARL